MAMWIIEIHDLNGMTKADTTDYITTAIRAWANGSEPEHPFFGSFLDASRDGVMHVRELTTAQAITVKATMKRFR
jgi:hypothetical protein